MVVDYVFSDESFSLVRKFIERFDCTFRIDEPSGDALLLDIGDDSYRISADESADEFKKAIEESLRTGKNLLLDKYRANKVDYDNNMTY